MSDESRVVLQPMQWSHLDDIHAVAPLSDADAPLMKDLRNVLLKHGALNRFGITLLHKHFDMADGERLLESTDILSRTLTLSVVAGESEVPAISTTWKFSEEGTDYQLITKCQCPWDPLEGRHSGRHPSGTPTN